MLNHIFVVCVAAAAAVSCEEDWVWKDGARSSKSSRNASPRYEVLETGDLNDFIRPNRPIFGNAIGNQQLPNRPGVFNPIRPGGSYGQNSYPVRPGYEQGVSGQGLYGQGNSVRPDQAENFGPGGPPDVLTGPVPSWERVQPFRHFDTCKCTEKFNCNVNGVAYGHCDVGKQYCCSSRKYGPAPSRPVHSPENGILVGPGGPIDRPARYPERPYHPIRETYDGSPYDGDAGVLIGPGGPTGIIGRPPKGGPAYPYGPNNAGFSAYARSNKD